MSRRDDQSKTPRPFIWRRLHSLTGLFLVLYLFFHLFTNSQAALFFGDDGKGFIHEVNAIHNLPYLIFIELFLLGLPFAVHMVWGIRYLLTSEPNSRQTDGTTPSLPEYGRNRAYTWQRITSYLLLIGIIAHVVHMRILHYPTEAKIGSQERYMIRLNADPGLYTVADRLGVQLFDAEGVERLAQTSPALVSESSIGQNDALNSDPTAKESIRKRIEEQRLDQQYQLLKDFQENPLAAGQVVAVANSFALPVLLMVRQVFQSLFMALLYTLFVLAACFHAFNGLWTGLITWGVTVNGRIQHISLLVCWALMALTAFLGIAAIWGTYWINLRD